MTIRSQMSLIMDLIRSERPELFALELKNCCISLCTLAASTNINQTAQNLVKIYMTIRSRMSVIMGLIGQERQTLFALELNKKSFIISLYLHSSIYKYQPISTNLCQNIYDHKTLDEFDYWSNRTGTTGVICP